jgi:hypothetical protein
MAFDLRKVDLLPLVQRFQRNFGKVAGVSLEETLDLWFEKFRSFTVDDVARGLSYLEDEWSQVARPRVADLRKAILTTRPKPASYRTPDSAYRCPSCGAHYWYAGYMTGRGTVVPLARCRCPHHDRPGSGFHHPLAREWREKEPDLIRDGWVPDPTYLPPPSSEG